jgi:SWI/SNF-related matrix-associated actin-dependent regulator 1 of chromatin subfamily A
MVVVSYALLPVALGRRYDFVIVDETHNIKNPRAKRTKQVLGKVLDGAAPGLLLTGTPIPNGRPNELWPVLNRCAPHVIDKMALWPFIHRFCVLQTTHFGTSVVGAKRRRELFTRLRGSGFMTRRLKEAVLDQLPPKRYKFVTLSAQGELKTILEKESDFDADEILRHGVALKSGLPELRREMGAAKVPHSIEYVKDLLAEGVAKVVVFGHHIEVMKGLLTGLAAHRPAMVIGSTRPADRQAAVDRFQNDPDCRVFIGNEAAEEGITLTAAQDLVVLEPEWTPGKNEQRADRLHRVGQRGSVLVHYLVVEGSLDARILARSAEKSLDSEIMLDKGIP